MTEKKMTATAHYIEDGRVIEVQYSTSGAVAHFLPKSAEAARKALNEWHRAEKARKPKKRYVACLGQDDYWYVRDRDTDSAIADFAALGRCEGHARLFAKALNKQERKRLDSNTVTPGTEGS